jgi:hypothetical protein
MDGDFLRVRVAIPLLQEGREFLEQKRENRMPLS